MYRITVDLPNLPHGELVEVDGVGIFKNGESSDLPEDFNVSAFLAHHNAANRNQDKATSKATKKALKAAGLENEDFSLTNAFALSNGVSIEEFIPVEYEELKVDELRTELRNRNERRETEGKEAFPLSGSKDDLVARLKEDDE